MDRLALGIEEAAEVLGISRTRAFAAVREGSLKSYKEGRRRMVSVREVEAYVERKQGGQSNSPAK